MTMLTARWWYVCDRGICLYSQAGIDGLLRRAPEADPRCIKHGALLFSDRAYDGMSKAQAKELLGRDR